MAPPGMAAIDQGSVRSTSCEIEVQSNAYMTATRVGRNVKRNEVPVDIWRKPSFFLESTAMTTHKIARIKDIHVVDTRKLGRSDTGSHLSD